MKAELKALWLIVKFFAEIAVYLAGAWLVIVGLWAVSA